MPSRFPTLREPILSATGTVILPSSVVAASERQVSAELDRDRVVLNVATGHYFRLQETGERIWNLLREPVRVATIVDMIVEEYEVERPRCERDLIKFLGEVRDRGLIDVEPDSGS